MTHTQTTEPAFELSLKALRLRAVAFCRLVIDGSDVGAGVAVLAEAQTFGTFLATDGMTLVAVARRERMLRVAQSLRPGVEAKQQVQVAEALLRYVEEG